MLKTSPLICLLFIACTAIEQADAAPKMTVSPIPFCLRATTLPLE